MKTEANMKWRDRLVEVRRLINQHLRLEDLAADGQTPERRDECRQGYQRMVAEVYSLLRDGDEG